MEKNSKVKWNWGNGEATGKIVEIYEENISKTIKGSEVKRNASKDEPAYLIEQDDGNKVLKSCTEVELS